MTEKLLSFLFFAILLALGYHWALDLAYGHFFPNSQLYITYWYIPLGLVPGILLAVLAWWMGFFRQGATRWGNVAALIVMLLVVILTLGAPYNCWNGC